MNTKQKEFLKKWLAENEMTFKIEEWNDVKAIHSSEIEKLYKSLKALEQTN